MAKYISSRELRNRTGALWKALEEEGELIITSHGKPVAIMCNIDEGDDLESRLKDIKTARAGRALEKMQMQSAEKGLDKLTDGDIEAEINNARQERA